MGRKGVGKILITYYRDATHLRNRVTFYFTYVSFLFGCLLNQKRLAERPTTSELRQ